MPAPTASQLQDEKYRNKRYSYDKPSLVLEMIWSKLYWDSNGKNGTDFAWKNKFTVQRNELLCYAAAINAFLDPGENHFEEANADLLRDIKDSKSGMNSTEHFFTNPTEGYFLKGGYWPGWASQYTANPASAGDIIPYNEWKKALSDSDTAAQTVALNKSTDGWIDGANEIHLKSHHWAWQVHLPWQQALKAKIDQLMQPWLDEDKPPEWVLPADDWRYAKALSIILDAGMPSRAERSSGYGYKGGMQYPLFLYYQRTDGKGGYQPCWGYIHWCSEVPAEPTNVFADSPWMSGDSWLAKKWVPFWKAIQNSKIADDLNVPSREKFVKMVTKKIKEVIQKIKHADHGRSCVNINEMDETIDWPRQSGFTAPDWIFETNSAWNHFSPLNDVKNLRDTIDSTEVVEQLQKAGKPPYSAGINPCNSFWGSPHKAMSYWANKKSTFPSQGKGPTCIRGAPTVWHFDKVKESAKATTLQWNWSIYWDIFKPMAADYSTVSSSPGNKAYMSGISEGWWDPASGGFLVFNFLKGLQGTNVERDYKLWDLIHPGDFGGDNDTDGFDESWIPETDDVRGRMCVKMTSDDVKKMLNEWFEKNPDTTLYGLDKDGNTKAIQKGFTYNLTLANAVYRKWGEHWEDNKDQWKNEFWKPQPLDRDIDDQRVDLNDATNYGGAVDEAYFQGLVEFHKNLDAYYQKAQNFNPDPDINPNADKVQHHAMSWGFARGFGTSYNNDARYKRIMQKGETYENALHSFDWDDEDERAEFKQYIEDLFVDHCALAIAAHYAGHARMEEAEAFLIQILKKETEDPKKLSKTDLLEAEGDAKKDLLNNNITSASPTKGSGALTDEEIEKRQKFFKQCALLLNLEQFVQAHRFRVNAAIADKTSGIHSNGKGPYNGRFWMLEDGGGGQASSVPDQSSMVNKLFIREDLYAFMNIPQAVVALMTPKLRLYQVYSKAIQIDGKPGDTLIETEFEFPQEGLGLTETDNAANRIKQMWSTEFDKGSGAGIKSFSWIYEGTSPATARNDISCDLSLHFQSFNDFFKSRVNSINGRYYKFVDLVLYPQHRTSDRRRDYDQGAKQEYDPSDYRIRVDVGWNVPPESLRGEINRIARLSQVDLWSTTTDDAGTVIDYYDQLRLIINNSNKSFYLNMVDHKMDIKDTGAVQIDINYRAYVETALKSTRFNALLDEETYIMKRNQKQQLINAKKKKCTRQDFMILRREIDRQNELITKNAHQSIMKRLIKRNKIYFVDVEETDKLEFERRGYFPNRPKYVNYDKKQAQSGMAVMTPDTQTRLKKHAKSSNIRTSSYHLLRDKWIDENVSRNVRVNYFFMGDLIYTILDVINGIQPDLEKTKILLGSFEYIDFDGRSRLANIADIPVSCDYFFEWYTQHVVKTKRQSFPVAYFIRTLCNHFITELLSDKCRNKAQVLKISFKTGTFMSAPHKDRDPFEHMVTTSDTTAKRSNGLERLLVQVGKYYDGTYTSATLPLTHYDRSPGANITQNFFHYMMVYPVVSPAINHPGTGDELQDRKRGVHHIHIGARTGVIKKVSFDRTDIQYIRESRFLNQGEDGLLQLGAVYKATIDMVGNTLWFPGMELYVNPLGVGGLELGFPNDSSSAANKLGLGGYHIITRIKSTIAPGVFNTQVEAQFHYSGDKSVDKQRLGFIKADDKTSIVDVKGEISDQCESILTQLQKSTAHLGGKLSRIDEETSYSTGKDLEEQNMDKMTENANKTIPNVPSKYGVAPKIESKAPRTPDNKRNNPGGSGGHRKPDTPANPIRPNPSPPVSNVTYGPNTKKR